MIEILPLEDSWGMPLQVGSLYGTYTHIVDLRSLYATDLSENADAVGALAQEDLDPWAAEEAWLWHQAD